MSFSLLAKLFPEITFPASLSTNQSRVCRSARDFINDIPALTGIGVFKIVSFSAVEGFFSLEYSFPYFIFQMPPSVIHPRVESTLSVQN